MVSLTYRFRLSCVLSFCVAFSFSLDSHHWKENQVSLKVSVCFKQSAVESLNSIYNSSLHNSLLLGFFSKLILCNIMNANGEGLSKSVFHYPLYVLFYGINVLHCLWMWPFGTGIHFLKSDMSRQQSPFEAYWDLLNPWCARWCFRNRGWAELSLGSDLTENSYELCF